VFSSDIDFFGYGTIIFEIRPKIKTYNKNNARNLTEKRIDICLKICYNALLV